MFLLIYTPNKQHKRSTIKLYGEILDFDSLILLMEDIDKKEFIKC
jgi:hypothetical protein